MKFSVTAEGNTRQFRSLLSALCCALSLSVSKFVLGCSMVVRFSTEGQETMPKARRVGFTLLQ